MTNTLHSLEIEIIDQVLDENPDFLELLENLSARHGVPPAHIALITNFLQQDLPPHVPAGSGKLTTMCELVRSGFYRIIVREGDLVLEKSDKVAPPGTLPHTPTSTPAPAVPAVRPKRWSPALLVVSATLLLVFAGALAYTFIWV